MIEIISGVCRTELGLKRPGDKPFSLTPAAEKRFVDREVAVYVHGPVTVEGTVEEAKEGIGIAGSHLDPNQLNRMKLDELKGLAADLDIDDTGLKTRADYIEVLSQVDLSEDNGEEAPVLSAEDPA